MNVLYNTALLAGLALASPALLATLAVSPRLRVSLRERARALAAREDPCTWVHAASVGEVEGAAPLIDALAAKGRAIQATTLTPTGRARLGSLCPESSPRLAPLDLPWLARRSVARARVEALVLIETEIWPNLIGAAHAAGAPVVIVGARLSDRGFRRYRRARALFRGVLRRVDAIGARSDLDRERFLALGAEPGRVCVTGELKLARSAPPEPGPALRAALGEGPWLVAGSTHPGEEKLLLEAWARLRADLAPDLRLLLAPRHPQRAAEVLRLAGSAGVATGLRSRSASGAPVVVLDTVGELASLYHLADLVFVGGSLVDVGGHNMLEAVHAGRVVVHGPHVYNQRAQTEILEPLGVLRRAEDGPSLEATLRSLWADPGRHAPARAARGPLEVHARAVSAAAGLIESVTGDAR